MASILEKWMTFAEDAQRVNYLQRQSSAKRKELDLAGQPFCIEAPPRLYCPLAVEIPAFANFQGPEGAKPAVLA